MIEALQVVLVGVDAPLEAGDALGVGGRRVAVGGWRHGGGRGRPGGLVGAGLRQAERRAGQRENEGGGHVSSLSGTVPPPSPLPLSPAGERGRGEGAGGPSA